MCQIQDSYTRHRLLEHSAGIFLEALLTPEPRAGTHELFHSSLAYGLPALYLLSNSSRLQRVRGLIMRSTARTPSRWSISCCKGSERSLSTPASSWCHAP